ncbi:MAG TPA: hypothetical protein DEA40_04260 [Parvularcula sp.]|nr:hypothetical protein [Parvularcula sp.]
MQEPGRRGGEARDEGRRHEALNSCARGSPGDCAVECRRTALRATRGGAGVGFAALRKRANFRPERGGKGDMPDIEPIEGDGLAETGAVAAAVAAAAACVSCGTAIAGPWCAGCGQRNDDMRRSSFVLLKDFLKDTFSFDGRMWRTLGLLAAAPGTVPSDYSHGRRSRYTPPVRLFLVVSFLFFLVLGLTHTLIVAVEVRARTPEETAAAQKAMERGLKAAGPEAQDEIEAALNGRGAGDSGAIVIDGRELDCEISVAPRFFVRSQDVSVDKTLWGRCRDTILSGIRSDLEKGAESDPENKGEIARTLTLMERIFAGVSRAVEDPEDFNASLNNWLPRMLFLMAPVLALIMTLFLRGRNALLFDHLVFSLYAHATAFAIIGIAVAAVQLGLPHIFTASSIALALYFIVAIRRGYKRGWIKSLWTCFVAGVLYIIVLSAALVGLISNEILQGA